MALLLLLPLIAGLAAAAPVDYSPQNPAVSTPPVSVQDFGEKSADLEKSALESGFQYFANTYNTIYAYQRGSWRYWDQDYWVEWALGRHMWGYDRNTLHFDTESAVTYSMINGVWDYHYMNQSNYGGGIVGFSRDEVYTVGRNATNSFLYRYNDVEGNYDWDIVANLGPYACTELWGLTPGSLFFGGFNGAFLHWDGTSLHELSYGVYGRIYQMWGTSAGDVYLIAEGNGLLHWDGETLAPVAGPDGFDMTRLRAVWGSGPDSVWAVGTAGGVIHFDGSGWVDQTIEGVTNNLVGVYGSGPDEVVAVGGNAVYKYDGTQWAPYNGISAGEISFSGIWGTYAENGDQYWDGRFTDGVEDGGLGINSTVRAVYPYDGGVVVGGSFTYAGPDTASRVALLQGDEWTPLYASTGPNYEVTDFIEYDGQLVMCGTFNSVDDQVIHSVAAWDGSSWNQLGDGIPVPNLESSYTAWRMTIWNGNLVVVGVPEVTAMWDGADWTMMSGFTGQAYDVEVFEGDLYAAGNVSSPGGVIIWNVNTSSWLQVSNNVVTSSIYAMEAYGDFLYIGGDFTMDGPGYSTLARWNGNSWSSIGTVTGSYVVDLGTYDGSLWVGGSFYQIDGANIMGGALWNATDGWQTMGSGVDNWSWSNCVDDEGALWIGGGLNSAGNKESRRIARWMPTPAALAGPPTTLAQPAAPGEDYALRINVTGDVGDRPIVVHYRRRDGDAYQGARMYPAAQKDGVFEGIVPGSYIQELGFQYYIAGGEEDDIVFPAGDPSDPGYAPAWTGVTMTNFEFTPPAANSYAMMGIPFVPNASQSAILQNAMGTYDKSKWRFGRWNPTTSKYVEFPNTPGFAPGIGYWLIQRERTTLNVNGVSTNTFGGVNIQLKPGWNMISTPYAFPILWSDVTLGAGVEDRLVARSGGTYVDVDVMIPWQGYWVLNTVLSDVVINIPPTEAPVKALENPVKDADEGVPAAYEWAINISAVKGDRSDVKNVAAVAAGAQDGVDVMDYHEPPAMPGDVSLDFLVEGGERMHHLSTDTRAIFMDGKAWDAELRVEGGGRVDLAFTGVDQVPDRFEVALITATGRIDLRATDTASVIVGESGSATLRLAVGDLQYLTEQELSLPRPFALRPNYPNPFNPRTKISFTLPYASRVMVDIYDIRGRKVRSLVDDNYDAGLHEIDWLGDDDGGRSVSTGVYFGRMRADGFEQVRKMTLVR